jgi:hypothetical protein
VVSQNHWRWNVACYAGERGLGKDSKVVQREERWEFGSEG